MQVPFGFSAYATNEYGLPPIALENWFAEEMPQYGQIRLIPRPGLRRVTGADFDIRGVFHSDGLVGGEIVFVDGHNVYRVNEAGNRVRIGGVRRDEYGAQFAAGQAQMVCVSGGRAFEVTAQGVTGFSWTGPVGAIRSVAQDNNRFLYAEAGSGRMWFSAPGVAQEIRAADFVTAETSADELRAIAAHGGSLYLMGSKTTELWAYTGSDAVPYRSRPGAVLNAGIIGPDAFTVADFGLFTVADDGIVYRISGLQPVVISTPAIVSAIKSRPVTDQRQTGLSSYVWNNHTFVRLTIPGGATFEYDVATGAWHRPRTLGQEGHIVRFHVAAFGGVYGAGDGGLYAYQRGLWTEGGEFVRRVATAIIPVDDGRPTLNRLTVQVSSDCADNMVARAMLKIARDTRHFGAEVMRELNRPGEFARPVSWGPFGAIKPPACIVELAISDPVGITVADAKANMTRP